MITAPQSSSTGTYCSIFDLTQTRKLSEKDRSLLHLVDVDELGSTSTSPTPYDEPYRSIEKIVETAGVRYVPDLDDVGRPPADLANPQAFLRSFSAEAGSSDRFGRSRRTLLGIRFELCECERLSH